MGKLYGVEQTNYGHCYRWVFTEETLHDNGIGKEEIMDSPTDISFPFGGSNAGATFFTVLEDDAAVKEFLLSDYTTEYEDPMLVDIAEGLVTIAISEDSITERYVKKFKITELSHPNKWEEDALTMIRFIKEVDPACQIDFENPFYGDSRDMRYSELCTLFKECFMQTLLTAAENGLDELDFYMDLLAQGVHVSIVKQYVSEDAAAHMEEFCSSHGLI